MKHRKDHLPVLLRAFLVVEVAVGQGISMLGALMDLAAVTCRRVFHQVVPLLDHRQRRVFVCLGKTAIDLALEFLDVEMR